ncbi:MAG: nicotinate-nucleotide--dimethylbenzimidazole phosphoribosyltransferase [Actinobacteria bacterium]|nr:nicotinate-nucleotide--dimethylbenzimidazole phosphoribosyltransferase [Actinomycetota bacterium]
MKKLQETINSITGLDEDAMLLAGERQDSLTKPPGALGMLEELSIRVAGITGEPRPKIGRKVVIVMAGDHGVTAEGVSAYPSEVTPQMVLNFAAGGAAINVLARHVGAEVVVVDIGVATDVDALCVECRKVKSGTDNFARGPAMSIEEAVAVLETGIEIAEREIDRGATLIATGDMGIGNTTASSALLAAFTGLPLNGLVGKGTGIEEGLLGHKREVIESAIRVNKPDGNDPLDALAKLGGLEIGGLAGVILGAASRRTPVVIDGFISGAAALVAAKLAPRSVEYMIASHVSVEPGHRRMLEVLGLKPMLYMDMRLGEGTGAALGMALVEAATKIINEMATFEEAGVTQKEAIGDQPSPIS